jgi:hypothetical protein
MHTMKDVLWAIFFLCGLCRIYEWSWVTQGIEQRKAVLAKVTSNFLDWLTVRTVLEVVA